MEKMVKRLLSVAIALAMVLSWLPTTALQAEAVASGDLCACGCGETASAVNWQALTDGALTQDGHYYLSADLALTETLTVSDQVTLDLRGKIITPAEGTRTILVNSGASLTILDTVGGGEIYGGAITGDNGGAIYVNSNAALNILSGVVRDGSADRGGNICSYGTTVISGKARVTGGNAQRGGNIYVTGGTTTVTGYATVLDGVASSMGGNCYVTGTSYTLKIAGRATVAGGDCSGSANIASMYGKVIITDNAVVDAGATGSATSVQITGTSDTKIGSLSVSGGTVYGKLSVSGYVNTVEISGAPVIKHLALATGVLINPTGMTNGASVTVEAVDTAITDTLTDAATYLPYFHAYTSGNVVSVNNDALQIVGGCPCGCGAADVTWTSWAGGAITESGHYRLSGAKTISSTVEIAEGLNVTIDLNGKALTASGARAFFVYGTLNIVDIAGSGTINGADITSSGEYGGTILVEEDAVLNLYGGTITGGTAARGGNIQSYGTIHMYDGASITNGTSSRGDNINNAGDLYIYGGTISNDSNNIYSTYLNNTVYIVGGTVTTTGSVKNIDLFGSSLHISGGTITGGTIQGSEYTSQTYHSRVVVTGGTVNSAITVSGATYKPEVVITGGTMTGGVSIAEAESFHIAGTPTISTLTLGAAETASLGEIPMDAEFPNATAQGVDGNIKWVLKDGVLLLSGTGAMTNYGYNEAPWDAYKTQITAAIIGDGITTIGNCAFYECSALTQVHIPEGVTSIGTWAFHKTSVLTHITFPVSLQSVGSYAFRSYSYLTSAAYRGTKIQWSAVSVGNNTALTNLVSNGAFTYLGGEDNTTATIQRPTNNTAWTVSGNTLTISGSGAMNDYYYDTSWTKYNGTPWRGYADQITTVVIESGITSVGNWAFYGLKNLTSVTIPSTVTTIGDSAFRGCSALQTVNLGSATKIGNYAFYGCTALTEVTASSLTTIGAGAFSDCAALTSLTGVTAVNMLGSGAFDSDTDMTAFGVFDGCTSLTAFGAWFGSNYAVVDGVLYSSDKTTLLRVPGGYTGDFTVPDGVITIADYAFFGCENLTNVTISDSVTAIGGAAFDGCTAVQTIHLGAGVSTYGTNAFAYCDSQTAFTVSAGNTTYAADNTGALCYYASARMARAPGGVAEYTVNTGVKYIETYAFACNNVLTEVTLDESTIDIRVGAFSCTDRLQTVNMAAAVTTVRQGAFEASTVTDVNYTGTLAQYNTITVADYNEPLLSAKVHCTVMESTSCGDGVTAILDNDGLLTISGTGAITSAPWSEYADQITTVVMDEGITAICDNAFNGCTNLTAVNYGGTAAQWNRMTVGEGNDVLEAAQKTFADAVPVGITVVTLPTKLDYEVGETVDTTGMEVNIVYNDETTAPADLADCVIGELTMPGKQTVTVTYGDLTTTFQVNVSASGKCGEDINWILDAEGKLTLTGNGEMESVEPTLVAWYDYMACITSVEIGEGITGTLAKHAFRNASNLKSVSIPEGITRIGSSAFLNCVSLTEVDLPNSVVDIRASAFSGCTSLKTVSIGTNMTLIQSGSFKNCTALSTVNYAGSKTAWNGITVEETNNSALLNATFVYGEKIAVGVEATWTDAKAEYYMNEEIDLTGLVVTVTYDDDSTEETADYTVEYDFTTAGTKNVTVKYAEQTVYTCEVTVLPAGVSEDGFSWSISAEGVLSIVGVVEEGSETDIVMTNYTEEAPAPWAAYAETVTTVVIVGSITNIGDNAFNGCVNMTTVAVPQSVTVIGANAFSGCDALTDVTYSGIKTAWNAIKIGEGNDKLLAATLTCSVLPGDADGNGEVNCLDAILILQWCARWDVTIDEKAANVNADGKVNNLDAILILQWIAGWAVELLPAEN